MNRRTFLAALGSVPATAVAAGALPASAGPVQPAFHAFPSHARGIITDTTLRTYGPIMFIGDSTSAKRWGYVRRDFSAAGIGPYRIDLNLARSLSRDGRARSSGVTAVRDARAAGFDPPAFVIALGFSDIIGSNRNRSFPASPTATTLAMMEPLMEEIGPDRTVGFLSLYGTVGYAASRARLFNVGLAAAAERWPNLVVVDWAGLARRNKWWHKSDGFHYGYTGSIKRQRFIVRALQQIATHHATTTTTTTTTTPAAATNSTVETGAESPSSGA